MNLPHLSRSVLVTKDTSLSLLLSLLLLLASIIHKGKQSYFEIKTLVSTTSVIYGTEFFLIPQGLNWAFPNRVAHTNICRVSISLA